jgi:hypothetical protein
MMLTEMDYQVKKEYYADQRRAAARWKRAQEARTARDWGERFYARALSWLGDRLVAWGSRLQAQYETVVSSAVSKTARPAVGQ